MIDDLIAFVTARLDEREALAKDAALTAGWDGFGETRIKSGERWSGRYHEVVRQTTAGANRKVLADCGGLMGIDIANHIVANDPHYMLRDIAAKRRIIALYPHIQMSEPWGDNPPVPLGGEGPEVYYDMLCLIAMIDAAHPDYKPVWNARPPGGPLKGLEA